MPHHDRRIPRAQTVELTVKMNVMFSTPVGPSMTVCQHGTLMDCCHKLALTTIYIATIILRDTLHQISLMLEKHYHPNASENRHYPRVCAIGCDIHFPSIL